MPLHVTVDAEETATTLVRFIRDYVAQAGAEGVVLGMSGGLDSAVVGALAARAVGPERVRAFFLPSNVTPDVDHEDARVVCEAFQIKLESQGIAPIVEAASEAVGGEVRREERANMMARARMMCLYGWAQRHASIVLGTGNKSELLTGYFTKHGDGGVDLLPIGDLYKTQVRELAEHLGVPAQVIERPPSAGLWEGQTDEEELGMSYEQLDRILLGLEVNLAPQRIADDAGVRIDEVRRIEGLRRRTAHKRRSPMVPKLGIRSTGSDWRDPVMGAHDHME